MEDQMCFDCLHRRIRADFSDKLVFSNGISDSHLPFGSTAVVQVLCLYPPLQLLAIDRFIAFNFIDIYMYTYNWLQVLATDRVLAFNFIDIYIARWQIIFKFIDIFVVLM